MLKISTLHVSVLVRVHSWHVFGWHLFLVHCFAEKKKDAQHASGNNIQAIEHFN
jgi:hypothetical protein